MDEIAFKCHVPTVRYGESLPPDSSPEGVSSDFYLDS